MVKIVSVIAGLLIAVAFPASAQETQDPLSDCRLETARSVSVAQLHTDESLRHQCVSVDGVLDGNRLFDDREAMALPIGPFDEGNFEDGAEREAARANIQLPNRILLQRSAMPHGEGPTPVQIIGIADNCAAIQDEAAARNEAQERETGQIVITLIGGTCHYHSEAYLDPVSITFLSFERLTRFTAAEIEPDQSDLIQFSDEELPEGVNLEFAELMVRAIADGDQAAFLIAANEASRPDDFVVSDDLQIQARVIQEIGEGDARLEVGEQSSSLRRFFREMWLRAVDAKFSARKVRGVDAPERRLYFLRSTIEYETLYPDKDYPREVIVCWCKSEDCSDKWPVLARDADALNSRPYFCLWVDQHKVSGKETLSTSVELPSTEYGFAEPDWDGDGWPG